MNILLADDEPDIRKSLTSFVKKLGHKVTAVSDGADALREFHGQEFDVMITDLRLLGSHAPGDVFGGEI